MGYLANTDITSFSIIKATNTELKQEQKPQQVIHSKDCNYYAARGQKHPSLTLKNATKTKIFTVRIRKMIRNIKPFGILYSPHGVYRVYLQVHLKLLHIQFNFKELQREYCGIPWGKRVEKYRYGRVENGPFRIFRDLTYLRYLKVLKLNLVKKTL